MWCPMSPSSSSWKPLQGEEEEGWTRSASGRARGPVDILQDAWSVRRGVPTAAKTRRCPMRVMARSVFLLLPRQRAMMELDYVYNHIYKQGVAIVFSIRRPHALGLLWLPNH